jgi:hypothetical protein
MEANSDTYSDASCEESAPMVLDDDNDDASLWNLIGEAIGTLTSATWTDNESYPVTSLGAVTTT